MGQTFEQAQAEIAALEAAIAGFAEAVVPGYGQFEPLKALEKSALELRELRESLDVLRAENARLTSIANRAKELVELLVSTDAKHAVHEYLIDNARNTDDDYASWADWCALMDADVGLLAQINQTGQYTDEEQTMVDTMLNGGDDD